MKILIVNGYSKASAGIQFFSEFQYFIKKVYNPKKNKKKTTKHFLF